jgi:O-antigen/teichoic acid export membrane protein
VLGVEGVGTIGLIWASISINVTINSIFSGNTIVYFINRYAIRSVYVIATVWTFTGSAIGCAALQVFGLLPGGYAFHIYGLTVLYSLGVAHSRFLLGKDHIRGFNLTNLLQGGLLLFILLFFYYVAGRQEVGSYVKGLYLTNGIAFVVSLALVFPYLAKPEPYKGKSLFSIMKEMFTYGLWGSADNIAESCTARLNYFLVEHFAGLGSVGLLDAGTRIAESVWNISRGMASILYNRIAKSQDRTRQTQLTLQLFRLAFLAVTVVTAGVLLVPEWFYTDYLFTAGFKGVRGVIIALSAGIVMQGCNTILSHYYIGSGKIRYSTAVSCTGLCVLLLTGFWLIPAYGVTGSAWCSSIAFTAMLAFSLRLFAKQTQCRWRDFLPGKDDFHLLA